MSIWNKSPFPFLPCSSFATLLAHTHDSDALYTSAFPAVSCKYWSERKEQWEYTRIKTPGLAWICLLTLLIIGLIGTGSYRLLNCLQATPVDKESLVSPSLLILLIVLWHFPQLYPRVSWKPAVPGSCIPMDSLLVTREWQEPYSLSINFLYCSSPKLFPLLLEKPFRISRCVAS